MGLSVYQSPGVYVQQTDAPLAQVSALSEVLPALVGKSIGYQESTEEFLLSGTISQLLTNLVGDVNSVVLRDQLSGTSFVDNTDYSVAVDTVTGKLKVTRILTEVTSENVVLTGSAPSTLVRLYPEAGTVIVRDVTGIITYIENTDYTVDYRKGTITRQGLAIGSGNTVHVTYSYCAILSGSFVQASYHYQGSNYFNVFKCSDFSEVTALYGIPFSSNGTLQSELSLAAYFAFQNGAAAVYCVAVNNYTVNYPGTVTLQDVEDAINKLSGLTDIQIIVPIYIDDSIYDFLKSFVTNEAAVGHMCRGLVGYDGTFQKPSSSVMQAFATGLNSERMFLVNTPTIKFFNPVSNTVQLLGGQYVAAAVAGKIASQSPQVSLTRKSIAGFYDLDDIRGVSVIKEETRSGLLSLTKRNNSIIVFQGVTTYSDSTSSIKREISVGVSSDYMVEVVVKNLDSLIGNFINNDTPMVVKGQVVGVLENLKSSIIGVIADYQNVAVRQVPGSPTVIEVKFEYKPVYPLNYIQVYFSVNTQTGEITASPVA